MDTLLSNFDGEDDVKEILHNISDETIDKVFEGTVMTAVTFTAIIAHTQGKYGRNLNFRPIKAYHLDGSDISEDVAGRFGF